MKSYESHIAKVAADASAIYSVVSDLRNLERVRDLIPQDKVQEFETDVDFIRLKVDGLGQKIIIRIVDRIENDTVKFGIENLAGNKIQEGIDQAADMMAQMPFEQWV